MNYERIKICPQIRVSLADAISCMVLNDGIRCWYSSQLIYVFKWHSHCCHLQRQPNQLMPTLFFRNRQECFLLRFRVSTIELTTKNCKAVFSQRQVDRDSSSISFLYCALLLYFFIRQTKWWRFCLKYFPSYGFAERDLTYGTGQNPDIWHKPLEFKPERQLSGGSSELVLAEPDMQFISFSAGRQGYIALTLGTAMMVLLRTRLLQGFSWSMPHGLPAIDHVELDKNLYLAKPLVLQAEHCLSLCMYHA